VSGSDFGIQINPIGLKPVSENIGTDTAKFHEMNVAAKEKKNKNRKISVQKRIQQTEQENASDHDWKRNAIYMEEYLQVVNIETLKRSGKGRLQETWEKEKILSSLPWGLQPKGPKHREASISQGL
jgi:hypothetical protein